MTRDIKEWFACWLQSILALNVLSFQKEGLPGNFDDIPIVNVYEAPREKGGDWKQYLKDKREAWIITSLHYSSGTGSKYIRKASGGGRWNGHGPQPLKKNLYAYFEKRNYTLEGTGVQIPTYTMFEYLPVFEYLPAQDKPPHALCRITVDNMNIASSQQQEGKEINHQTDSNNRDKRKTSLSQKSMQQDGNSENATVYSNQSDLETFFARVVQGGEISEFRKYFTKDYIVQVFSRNMDERPAASPMEHITEAAVRNPKRSHGNNMKTITEADVCTQRKKQTKVEMVTLKMLEYHNLPVLEGKGHKHKRGQNFSDGEIQEIFSRTGYEKERALRKTSYNQNTIAPGPSTSNHATTVPETIGGNDIYENLSPISDGPYWNETTGDWLFLP